MFDELKLEALQIDSILNNNVSAVRVVYTHPEFGVIEATGSARRHPGDRNDRSVGYTLALGRALENLGRKIQRRANGSVAMADARTKQLAARAESKDNHPARGSTSKVVSAAKIGSVKRRNPSLVTV